MGHICDLPSQAWVSSWVLKCSWVLFHVSMSMSVCESLYLCLWLCLRRSASMDDFGSLKSLGRRPIRSSRRVFGNSSKYSSVLIFAYSTSIYITTRTMVFSSVPLWGTCYRTPAGSHWYRPNPKPYRITPWQAGSDALSLTAPQRNRRCCCYNPAAGEAKILLHSGSQASIVTHHAKLKLVALPSTPKPTQA